MAPQACVGWLHYGEAGMYLYTHAPASTPVLCPRVRSALLPLALPCLALTRRDVFFPSLPFQRERSLLDDVNLMNATNRGLLVGV
jgi:hypothetical protein